MKKIFNSLYFKVLIKLLVLFTLAKILTLVVLIYLPNDGIELQSSNHYEPAYKRVSFTNMLNNTNNEKENIDIVTKTNHERSLDSMLLKGLYGSRSKGFAIIALKSSPNKTDIVGISETYQGYTLKTITQTSAILSKRNKDYILYLKKQDAKSNSGAVKANSSNNAKTISRYDIERYARNPKKIWKDISIVDVKKNNKLEGFKITRVKHGSKFDRLGLKRGDIIIKANNVRLKSYTDALVIYRNIKNLDALQIVIKRNNKEMEFVYEIN